MDDLISREAAIKKLKYRYPGVGVDGSKERLRFLQYIADVEAIKEVPSVEPSIVRCKNCKYWDKDWQTIEGCHYCCMIDMQTEGEFFCAKGERRGDERGRNH